MLGGNMMNNVPFMEFVGCIVKFSTFRPPNDGKADIKYDVSHQEKSQIDESTIMVDR